MWHAHELHKSMPTIIVLFITHKVQLTSILNIRVVYVSMTVETEDILISTLHNLNWDSGI